jgi:hypothetical protein
MGDPRAFVSFDFDHDETSRRLFVGQAKEDSPTPFVVQDWSSKYELPQSQWEKNNRRKNKLLPSRDRFGGSSHGISRWRGQGNPVCKKQ